MMCFFLMSILQHDKKTDCLSVKKIAYSTFVNYRNVIYNHLLKSISPRIYITNIESSDLIKFMDSIASNPLRCNAYAVISSSFKTAKEFNIIAQNPAPYAVLRCSNNPFKDVTEKKNGDQTQNFFITAITKYFTNLQKRRT